MTSCSSPTDHPGAPSGPGSTPAAAPATSPATAARAANASRPLPRPTLLPGLRRLWRGRRRLQLGVDPARAVVLELPDAGTARVLDLLDGSRSERAVIAQAQRYGIRAADARAVLESLTAAGLVVGAQSLLPHTLPDPLRGRLAAESAALALHGTDAPGTPAQILRRRAAARVAVTGNGRLAAPVALALAQAGVGHVAPPAARERADRPEGDHADRALADTVAQLAPGTQTRPLRRRETTFAVQVGPIGPAVLAAAGYAERRLAHLAIAVRDGVPVIGPLVPPAGSPCLHCVDLHRRDRDPDWPVVAAQLATEPVPEQEPCAAATVLTAAGVAAGEVLAWLDGTTPTTLGASIDVTGPGRLRRRSWPGHPRCSCRRTPPRWYEPAATRTDPAPPPAPPPPHR